MRDGRARYAKVHAHFAPSAHLGVFVAAAYEDPSLLERTGTPFSQEHGIGMKARDAEAMPRQTVEHRNYMLRRSMAELQGLGQNGENVYWSDLRAYR